MSFTDAKRYLEKAEVGRKTFAGLSLFAVSLAQNKICTDNRNAESKVHCEKQTLSSGVASIQSSTFLPDVSAPRWNPGTPASSRVEKCSLRLPSYGRISEICFFLHSCLTKILPDLSEYSVKVISELAVTLQSWANSFINQKNGLISRFFSKKRCSKISSVCNGTELNYLGGMDFQEKMELLCGYLLEVLKAKSLILLI